MRNRSNIDRAQIYAIAKTLEAVGKVDGQYYEYNDKWSDRRVAETHKCTEHNVAGVRKQVFGPISAGQKPGSQSVLHQRLASIETRLDALEAAATDPASTFFQRFKAAAAE